METPSSGLVMSVVTVMVVYFSGNTPMYLVWVANLKSDRPDDRDGHAT